MRRFCFRFDIDTPRCLQYGVPNLLDVAASLQVPLTFFVNMGRGVSRRSVLCRMASRSQAAHGGAPDGPPKLSNTKKLGLWHYLWTAVANPEVGASMPNVLQRILRDGHELGLHGGTNHGLWQRSAPAWPEDVVRREVEWSSQQFQRALGSAPRAFSSPGWQGSPAVYDALCAMGFDYAADLHEAGGETVRPARPGRPMLLASTTITGAGGVGYVESLSARGVSDADGLDEFRQLLDRASRFAVVYDHPGYAGIQGLHLVSEMITTARDMGFEITTLERIVAAERNGTRDNNEGGSA